MNYIIGLVEVVGSNPAMSTIEIDNFTEKFRETQTVAYRTESVD